MGLQIRCPLCGFNRAPDHFEPRLLEAKDVRSLGGNRGFEHVETDVPEEVEAEIIEVIEALSKLYHSRPFEKDSRGSETGSVERESMLSEIDAAIEDGLAQMESGDTSNGVSNGVRTDFESEIEREVGREVEREVIDREVDREVEREIKRAEIEREIDAAIEERADQAEADRAEIEREIGRAVIDSQVDEAAKRAVERSQR